MNKFSQLWQNLKTDQRGMTLIDVAIALTVVALIAYPLIKEYDNYMAAQKRNTVNAALGEANAAIEKYFFANGRYPCPADSTLDRYNPSYGVALYNETNGVCVMGGADLDQPTDVAQGMLPFKTLKMPESSAYDPWNNRITYAVSAGMAAAGFNQADYNNRDVDGSGAYIVPGSKPYISMMGFSLPYVMDYDLHTTYNTGDFVRTAGTVYAANSFVPAGNTPPDPAYWTEFVGSGTDVVNPGVHYVLISHGPNGVGAYNYNAQQTEPCIDGAAREAENCNGNDTFFDRGSPDYGTVNVASEVSENDYYDDYVLFRDSWEGDYVLPTMSIIGLPGTAMMWSPENVLTGEVENKSFKVGLGVEPPDDSLDVDGDINIENGNAESFEICNNYTYDTAGDPVDRICFATNVLAGSTIVEGEEVGYIWCEYGLGFARGISNSDASCDPTSIDYFGGVNGACPAGQVMTGITGGVIQCAGSPF